MPPINLLIKPASGNCNLRCSYCFYYDTMQNREVPSFGMMTEATLEQVIKKALNYADIECTIAYQGGEPTLRGLDFFRKSIELQRQYNTKGLVIHNALQTNGYLLTKEWADFFVEHHFLVGISVDGIPKTHDAYRRTPDGQDSFSKVMETTQLFRRRGVEFNILTVINQQTAPQIRKIYKLYQKNRFDYLQFIACLDPIGEARGQRDYSLTPVAYGTFLKELFDLWCEDLREGKQPYIRQFENYISILLGMPPESCEQRGSCGIQYVIEADGSVYPCDFYVMDEYWLGELNTQDFAQIDAKREALNFIEASVPHSKDCDACEYYLLCRGGCNRNRIQEKNGMISYFCQAYQAFFEHCLPRMKEIAFQITQRNQVR